MSQYNLLHLDIFKDHSFRCGSVLFIDGTGHTGTDGQAVPCTECGSGKPDHTASLILTLAALVGTHLGSISHIIRVSSKILL